MPSFLDSIRFHDKKTALIEPDGNKISYSTLFQEVDNLCSKFLKTKDVAIMICKNNKASIAGYLAFITSDIVPILLGPKTPINFLNNYINIYRPRYLYLDFFLDNESYFVVESKDGFQLYVSKEDFAIQNIHLGLRLLLTTSGSTGSPKLVRVSDRNLRINSKMICSSLPMRDEDIAITTLPFNYSYGLSILNTHLLKGLSIQLNEYSVIQRDFWELLYDSKSTTFGGVPFLYQQINQIGAGKLLSSSVRYLTQAGGKLSGAPLESIYRICAEGKIEFYVMYGQTEATARMSVLSPTDASKHPGSIGKAIAPGHFSLIPYDVEHTASDRLVGELVFHGENVALGYAQKLTDLELGDEFKGILKTGDLAYFDEEGFPYIVGRINRFGKVRGVRFSFDDLELMFQNLGFNVVVLEIEDKLFLLANQDIDITLIDETLRDNVGLRFKDFTFRKMVEIPRTHSGKVDYASISHELAIVEKMV
jgi:acyl-CoA synthetase (AMP-forming)/AMP-acid ligase II